MAGYSGKPLHHKLGIQPGMSLGLVNAPEGALDLLGDVPEGVDLHSDLRPSNIFLVFAVTDSEVTKGFNDVVPLLPADGGLWLAWPKRSSGVPSELTENRLRDLILPTGMVDNKVCAIDQTWSGLRFVVRKENRDTWATND